ncbi:MAG: tetratricopeptide repeat protein [Spirochaetaceae bacterium]|nr:tetratricopeptide repeat protein [Spirochaetaceae bacterium]
MNYFGTASSSVRTGSVSHAIKGRGASFGLRLLPAAIRMAVLCLLLALSQAPAEAQVPSVRPPSGMLGADLLRMTLDGKYGEVALLAPEVLKRNSADLDAYIGYAWSLNALGQHARARDVATEGYSRFKDARLAQALGEACFNLGENEIALKYLQEYLAYFPEGNRAAYSFYLCGEIYIRLGKFSHADIALSAALQFNPAQARWWERLGWAREKNAQYLSALKAYEQAVSLNPGLQDAQQGRSRMLARIQG